MFSAPQPLYFTASHPFETLHDLEIPHSPEPCTQRDPQCKSPFLCKTPPDIRKRAATTPSPPHAYSPSLIGHILQESVMFFTGSVSTNRGLWKTWRREKCGVRFFSALPVPYSDKCLTNPVTHMGWHPALKCSRRQHKGLRKRERVWTTQYTTVRLASPSKMHQVYSPVYRGGQSTQLHYRHCWSDFTGFTLWNASAVFTFEKTTNISFKHRLQIRPSSLMKNLLPHLRLNKAVI